MKIELPSYFTSVLTSEQVSALQALRSPDVADPGEVIGVARDYMLLDSTLQAGYGRPYVVREESGLHRRPLSEIEVARRPVGALAFSHLMEPDGLYDLAHDVSTRLLPRDCFVGEEGERTSPHILEMMAIGPVLMFSVLGAPVATWPETEASLRERARTQFEIYLPAGLSAHARLVALDRAQRVLTNCIRAGTSLLAALGHPPEGRDVPGCLQLSLTIQPPLSQDPSL